MFSKALISKTILKNSAPIRVRPTQTRFFAGSSDRQFDIAPTHPDIDLHDIGGNQMVIRSLIDIVNYIKSPTQYIAAGITPPKGVIISGKPGTGKTLLAKALAGHTGLPLLQVAGSSMLGEHVGQGERLLRELFVKAKAIAPCIVCIDEIDSIGGQRFTPPKQGSELQANTTVNQLLTLLEDSIKGVVVIATTNHYHSLDSALVRPGRFDKHIMIPLPNVKDREHILSIHTKNKQLDSRLSLGDLAILSPEFSGAKLAEWVNQAARLAFQEGVPISVGHFEAVRKELEFGVLNPQATANPKRNKLIAIHEAGHALVGHLLGETVHQISINQYGESQGQTIFLIDEDNIIWSERTVFDVICRCLAGRAAEHFMGTRQFGSESDLQKAIILAKNFVLSEGLGKTLTGLNYQLNIETILQKQLERAVNLIRDNAAEFKNIVDALTVYKELNKDEFLNILHGKVIENTFFTSKQPQSIQMPISMKQFKKYNKDYIAKLIGIEPFRVKEVSIIDGKKLKVKFYLYHSPKDCLLTEKNRISGQFN